MNLTYVIGGLVTFIVMGTIGVYRILLRGSVALQTQEARSEPIRCLHAGDHHEPDQHGSDVQLAAESHLDVRAGHRHDPDPRDHLDHRGGLAASPAGRYRPADVTRSPVDGWRRRDAVGVLQES